MLNFVYSDIDISTMGWVNVIEYVGKIDVEKFKHICDNIKSADVVITDKQISHINERHNGLYSAYGNTFCQILSTPDVIFKDSKNASTALVCKQIFTESNGAFCIVLRLIGFGENTNYKNSIITAHLLSDAQYKKYLRNKKAVYIRE